MNHQTWIKLWQKKMFLLLFGYGTVCFNYPQFPFNPHGWFPISFLDYVQNSSAQFSMESLWKFSTPLYNLTHFKVFIILSIDQPALNLVFSEPVMFVCFFQELWVCDIFLAELERPGAQVVSTVSHPHTSAQSGCNRLDAVRQIQQASLIYLGKLIQLAVVE